MRRNIWRRTHTSILLMILSDTKKEKKKEKKKKGFSDHIQIKGTINEVKSAVGNTSIQAIK